ncbi:MAG: ABC transporter substrate-binding protein [bacterium]|nr:ABC transporter substrate-binding protein [bacterium]
MQSKFGLKDFILYVLVFLLTITVVFAMRQNDRNFERLSALEQQNDSMVQTLSQIRDEFAKTGNELVDALSETLRAEVQVIQGQIDRLGDSASGISVSEGQSIDAEGRDISWARPGVPVVFPRQYEYINDPFEAPDYSTGGEFIETFEAQFPKITPYFYSDVYGRRIVDESVCEQLGRYDPQSLEMVGLLAEAWQIDPDGEWMRAKINPRARFSDGVPVTSADVKFTYDLVFNPQHETERFRSTLNVIESVEAISERVVEFRFTTQNFSNVSAALTMTIIPKHFYEQFQPSQLNQATGLLMGSGPYRLERLDASNQWSQGRDLVLVRNENYWGRKPPIQRLRFKVIQDNVARLTDFENGNSHMMRGVSEQYRSKTSDPNFMANNYAEQWINMRSGFGFIAWNCGENNGEPTPFADARVRRAMTHLIDRERVLRDFANGLGDVATGPFPPAGPMNNPNITPRPYDLDASKRLLDEAGWLVRESDGFRYKDGKRFEFEYTISTSSTFSEDVANYLADQCKKVGIVCTIRKIDWAIFAETLDARSFDAITMQWSQSSPESDPYQLWHSNSIANRGDNFVQWSSPRADELIERGRRTLDDTERMKIWHELHEVFYEEQPYTFMLNSPWIRFISRDVSNVHTYPIGLDRNEMYFPADMN